PETVAPGVRTRPDVPCHMIHTNAPVPIRRFRLHQPSGRVRKAGGAAVGRAGQEPTSRSPTFVRSGLPATYVRTLIGPSGLLPTSRTAAPHMAGSPHRVFHSATRVRSRRQNLFHP